MALQCTPRCAALELEDGRRRIMAHGVTIIRRRLPVKALFMRDDSRTILIVQLGLSIPERLTVVPVVLHLLQAGARFKIIG